MLYPLSYVRVERQDTSRIEGEYSENDHIRGESGLE